MLGEEVSVDLSFRKNLEENGGFFSFFFFPSDPSASRLFTHDVTMVADDVVRWISLAGRKEEMLRRK